MAQKVETHKYPCWITRDEDGVLTVWRGKGRLHTDDLPPKPKRLRSGTTPVTMIGWVGIVEPEIEKGKGRWVQKDFKEVTTFRFSAESRPKIFPEIDWEDEPKIGRVCFNIELD